MLRSIDCSAGGHDDVNVDPDRLQVILDRMFDLFDTDGNGVVDFSELASGLSVLCGGSRDDKAKAAFSLFDYNGDGYISLEEMTRYLASVFKVMYETQLAPLNKWVYQPRIWLL